MDWNTGNNPWAPGGRMTAGLPWAQQGMQGIQYGWQQAGGYFAPKSQAQIQREALLQLAILAAVIAAPALLGAGGGAAGGAASAAGMGASAEAATAVTGQSALAAGAGASSGLGAAALQPFIGAAALQNLLGASMGGPQVLNQALQQAAPASRPSFVFDPGQVDQRLDKDGRHPALPMLDHVAHTLKLKPALAGRLQVAMASGQLQRLAKDRELMAVVAGAVAQVGPGNPWAGGGQGIQAIPDLNLEKAGYRIKKYNNESQFSGSIYEPYFDFLLQTNSVLKKFLEPFHTSSPLKFYYELRFDKLSQSTDSANTAALITLNNPENSILRTIFNRDFQRFLPPSWAFPENASAEMLPVRTDIAIARTIIHEAIHMNLYIRLETEPEFRSHYETYVKNGDQHEYMAIFNRKDIIDGLKQFAKYAGIQGLSDQDFEDLSWIGLQKSAAFEEVFGTGSDRMDWQNRVVNLEYSLGITGNVSITTLHRKQAFVLKLSQQ